MFRAGSAVFMIAALICDPFQLGWACLTSAAMPAVIGHAIDVPERTDARLPLPMRADATLTPGAITSGFGAESGLRGPPEEKPATNLKFVLGTVVGASFTEPPSDLSSAVRALFPAASTTRGSTPRNGMVTVCCSPVSRLSVIGASNGGRPLALLIITTAAAPASSPKTARATRAQVPRTVTTTMPAVPAYSALLQPSEIEPSAFRSTFTRNDVVGDGSGALLALIASKVPGVGAVPSLFSRFSVAPGTLRTPKPPAVPAVCDPWPLQSRGFGSGFGTEFGLLAL